MGLPASGRNAIAEPWQRFLSSLIDSAATYALVIVLPLIAGALSLPSIVGAVLVLAALIGYDPLAVHLTGQTLGKRVLGLRVAYRMDGRSPSFPRALGRWAVRLLGIFPPFALLDAVWCLVDERGQCLHDKAAGTVVVRLR